MSGGYKEVEQLVNDLRSGDKSAREMLVELHLGLAVNVAKSFGDEEVLSHVLVRLVELVDIFKVNGRNAAALPAFLRTSLRTSAIDFKRIEDRQTLQPPRRNVPTLALIRSKVVDSKKHEEFEAHELMDHLMACCETPLDKQIVKCRMLGMTLNQMELELGKSRSALQVAWKRLSLRWSMQRKLHA